MAVFTNQTKSSTTFVRQNITGIAQWSDSVATWADGFYSWGGTATQWVNGSKNSTTFANLAKN